MSKGNRAAKNSTGKNNTKKSGAAWLPNTLYVIAAVIAVIFVYMLIVNVMYIKNYLASYGMAFSDMWMDSIQYVLTGSISYLVYAILVFCAGRLISMLHAGQPGALQDAEPDRAQQLIETAGEVSVAEGAEADGEQKELDDETGLSAGVAKEQIREVTDDADAQADAGVQTKDGSHLDEDGAAKANLQADTDAPSAEESSQEGVDA